jgi:hypothetical protein
MIESAIFTDIQGTVLTMNTDLDYPFHELVTEVDVRSPERNRSQQHGMWPAYSFLGKRLWHLQGAILADSSAEYWQKRMNFIRVFTPRPHLRQKIVGTLAIQYTGIAEVLTCECTIDGWPEIPLVGLSPSLSEYQLNLKSPDPKLYGLEQSSFAEAPPVADYGRTYNKVYPKVYPDANIQPENLLITNSGNIETFPTFVIEGHVVNPRLVLTRYDNEQFTVALDGLTVTANDYVELDFLNRTAIMNGDTDVYSYTTTSEWWALEPTINGVDNIVSYAGTDIQEGSKATVYWRNAYMI